MKTAKNQKRGPGKGAKRKAALSAQQTIPYLVMHPDGVCQLPGGLYTKTVEYEDINYSVASTEDQTAIFGGWSSFLNYFDTSLPFQLSFTPEQLTTRVRSVERQAAARAHKQEKGKQPIAEQLKAAQREAQAGRGQDTLKRSAPDRGER